MIQAIIDFFVGLYHTPAGLWTIILYWVPMLVCLVGYFIEFVRDYQHDLDACGKYEAEPLRYSYNPKLTVGSIVGRLIVSVIPFCNFVLALFKHTGKIIRNVVQALADLLDIPIIRPRKSTK